MVLRSSGILPLIFGVIAFFVSNNLERMFNWGTRIAWFEWGTYLASFLLIISIICLFDFFYLNLKVKKIRGYWFIFMLNSILIIYTFLHTVSTLISTNHN